MREFCFISCFQSQTGPSQQDRWKYTYLVNLINEEANRGLLSPQNYPEMQMYSSNEAMETFLAEMAVPRNKK